MNDELSGVDLRRVPCRNCSSLSLLAPAHIYGERVCCPDCDHRPDETWPIRAALIAAIQPHNLGPQTLRIVDDLMPVVAHIAADAVQAEADELREVALLASDGQQWNPHRVWTLLSDRAETHRPDYLRGRGHGASEGDPSL